jgi:hypothetical protein
MNEYVSYHQSETEAGREAYELENDPDIESVKGVQLRKYSPGDRGVEVLSSDVNQIMSSLVKRQGYKDMHPAMQRELRLAAQEWGLQMLGSTRVHKRRMMRRKVPGASLDITSAFIDYAESTASYTARMEFAQEMNEAMRWLESSVDAGPRDGAKGRRAIANEVRLRVDKGNGFNTSTWSSPYVQRLMTSSFIFRLASPMYTMMNLLQVGMIAVPVIAGRHGMAPTVREISRAYRDIGSGDILLKGVKETYAKGRHPQKEDATFIDDVMKSTAINDREKEVFQFYTIRGGLEIAKLNRTWATSGGVGGKLLAGGDTALTWAEGVTRQLPTAAEAINRGVVLLAAYRLEYARNGGDHAAALRYADDTNNMANFNYSEVNTPRWLNHPLMKIPFQFKRFGHAMYSLLGQQLGRAWRNENPGDRAEALKSLAYIVATHVLMAGTLGLPTEIPKAIVLGLFYAGVTGFNWQDVETAERELAANLLGDDLGEVLTRGVTRALPFGLAFDLSQRVGMADMFLSREPNSGDPNDVKLWLQDMLVGAPGMMLKDYWDGGSALMSGDIIGAAEKMAPAKGLRDLIRAYNVGAFGKTTKSGRPSFDPYSFSEMFIRALGATPEREAEDSDLKAQFYSDQTYIRAERGRLEQQWADATTAQRLAMRGELERFNRNKPYEAQLKNKDLVAYTKRRRKEIEEMSSGIDANKSDRFALQRAERIYN